ncbi:MAG: ACT domain-containing protein, partial [Gammaproteobacteria bacterium]|nr:ACT domain-containing protein [Gammaproteobacteria bacterium]
MRMFRHGEVRKDFPLAHAIVHRLPKVELLYIAGLFHDLAKGRGGDHSELGSTDAYRFCIHHRLTKWDASLVSWLVQNHLLMSMTSQREDINDPEVVTNFARKVGDRSHLEYLYLLTVADIRGTNPTLWNDWRASLLRTLYNATRRALRAGLEHPIDRAELIEETQQQAKVLLRLYNPRLEEPAQALWSTLGDDYFLRATADEIAWHAQGVVPVFEHPHDDPLVLVRSGRSGTDVFIYARDQEYLFAATCSVLDRLGLSILDSRIITADNGMTLDSYVVVELDGSTVTDFDRHEEIRERLTAALREPGKMRHGSTRMPRRQLKAFNLEASARCLTDESNERTVVEVIAGDRPGLLARVGWVFADHDVRLQNARIATFGERAEDVFFVTDKDNSPLDEQHCRQLVEALEAALAPPR